jgi:hypothetical protein
MIEQNACRGNRACYGAAADYAMLKQGACSANYACMHFGSSANVYIGGSSCLGNVACTNIAGTVRIGDRSCLRGKAACSDVSGTLHVKDNSCISYLRLMACENVNGYLTVLNNSCTQPAVIMYMAKR